MARKNTTRRSKRNLDPLTAMSLAQTTGVDKALLGKRGFAALSDKRTYLGTGSNVRTRNPDDIEFLNDMAPQASLGHVEFTQDGIERYVREGYVYQAFTSTPVFEDGYRMGSVEAPVDQFAQQNPAKYERCVKAVQARGGANGYAVCTAEGLRNPRRRRRNPEDTSDAGYEMFHGAPPSETLELRETLHVHGHLWALGDLVHLVVTLTAGQLEGNDKQLNAPDPMTARVEDIVRLTANENRSQLYFSGGDQSLDLKGLGFRKHFVITHDGEDFDATDYKDLMEIGRIVRVMYRTEKAFDDFEEIDYHHLHGEDTKKYPLLLYDTMNSLLVTAGGDYAISPEGIVN